METRKILTILVVALVLMVASVGLSGAEPMGCAFTYQGRLIEAGSPAQGEYDFQFELYDEPVDGNQLDDTIDVNEVNVSDGYFTVVLDFGAGVFDGDARWLDIDVRQGALEDPNTYADLEPRQEVTPTPYALHAGSDNDWMVSGNDMCSIPSGNVGVGESNPLAKLHVAGNVIVEGASPVLLSLSDLVGAGDVGVEFTTSLPGSKKWAMMRDGTSGGFLIQESFPYPPFLGGTLFMEAGTGNVGIGTKDPEKLLQIVNKEGGYDGLGITLDPHGGGFVGGSTWDIDNDDGAFKLTESRALPGYPKTRLTILEGNVGIGTTEPSHKLNVIGDANITGSLYAGTGSTVLFVDDGNDRVGIGTTNPGTKLDVQGGDINTSGKIKEGGNNLIPSGAVMFFNLPSCPSGWSELTAARGRYLVGKPSGGTLAGTQGTALTDLENRAVGQHNHSITDPGHSHELASHGNMNCGSGCSHLWVYAGGYYTQSSTTGITIDNEGSVSGTNAPYIQLCACQKD
jgi:hypothetical protein